MISDIDEDLVIQMVAELQATGNVCEPDEIAIAVRFLASTVSSYMTGGVVPVDGGFELS